MEIDCSIPVNIRISLYINIGIKTKVVVCDQSQIIDIFCKLRIDGPRKRPSMIYSNQEIDIIFHPPYLLKNRRKIKRRMI